MGETCGPRRPGGVEWGLAERSVGLGSAGSRGAAPAVEPRLGLDFVSERISGQGLIIYVHDVLISGACLIFALYLRVGDAVPAYWSLEALLAGAVFMGICALVYWAMGSYRGVWRYASMSDLWAIAQGVSISSLIYFLYIHFSLGLEIPNSVFVINWFVLIVVLGGGRFAFRLATSIDLGALRRREGRVPILLAGGGDGTEGFLRALRQSRDPQYRAVGILVDHPGWKGRQIHGVKVLGTLGSLEQAVEKLRRRGDCPRRLVLTEEGLAGERLRPFLERSEALGMVLGRLPSMTELREGASERVDIRPVSTVDLLGRPQAALDPTVTRALVSGRMVLVTGAGGSIGSELVRQLSRLSPAALVLLDQSEGAIYEIEQELRRSGLEVPCHCVIADVRDRRRIDQVFAVYRPQLVFHAAALKHVPLVEENPIEGIRTNFLGSVNVAKAAQAHGAQSLTLISTDKAVNPSSIMGASKRLAEMWCQAANMAQAAKVEGGGAATRFVTVRFGNVLGSSGSVVPLFQRQLAAGGPLTVTHPEMTRYFMTIREAVELVVHAAALGETTPADGRIFVLDMGEPVKIVDLARQMIRLAGLKPDDDVKIVFTTPRPGEKLLEELFHGEEPPAATPVEGILVAAPRVVALDEMQSAVAEVGALCGRGDVEHLLELVGRLVPEHASPLAVGAHRRRGAEQRV